MAAVNPTTLKLTLVVLTKKKNDSNGFVIPNNEVKTGHGLFVGKVLGGGRLPNKS
jgi:hypothetical protein